jgi:hypothetical protein
MKIIAFIEARQGDILRKILEHCGPWHDPPPRAPPPPTCPPQPGAPARGLAFSPSSPVSRPTCQPASSRDCEMSSARKSSAPKLYLNNNLRAIALVYFPNRSITSFWLSILLSIRPALAPFWLVHLPTPTPDTDFRRTSVWHILPVTSAVCTNVCR